METAQPICRVFSSASLSSWWTDFSLHPAVQTVHFNLCPLPLIVPCSILGEPGSIFWGVSCRCWRAALWPPPAAVFCSLNKLVASVSPHRPCVSALQFDHLHNPCTILCLSVALPRDQAWCSRTEGSLSFGVVWGFFFVFGYSCTSCPKLFFCFISVK